MALSLMRISRGIYNVVLRYTEYVIPFFLSSPFLLLFFFENKLWYYTNLVKRWYAKQVILNYCKTAHFRVGVMGIW